MRPTQQPVLRRFWYAIMPLDQLADGPKPFTLLGQNIVLFLDKEGQPAALEDRCCHRTAKLSKGWCKNGEIVCGYHGWVYDRNGRLTSIPQLAPDQPLPATLSVPKFHAQARYGYAWVSLDEPLTPLFEIPEDTDPKFRRIDQFYETWKTSSLRFMENSFDNAHFAFVHRGTFGDSSQPKAEKYDLVETDDGFRAESIVPIKNPQAAWRITGTQEAMTKRHMRNHWYLPFCRRLDIEYPSGLRHIIFNSATPIDDGRIQLVQWLYRNDKEADCSAEELIAWDKVITLEDQDILEATDPDAGVDMGRKVEAHMPSDRPGMIMRKRLLALLRAHGEDEVFHPRAHQTGE
jgi:phenylpropionate dioxygenase-like ring-hydroxylating dioxygenase large terminal subunit